MILLIIYLTLFAEAFIESKYGDKRHWLSLMASVAVVATFAFFLGWDYLATGLIYTSGRLYFDYLYNLLKGNPWKYLGNNAMTDRFLKRFNPFFLFMFRFIGSAWCIMEATARLEGYETYLIPVMYMGYSGTLIYYLNAPSN